MIKETLIRGTIYTGIAKYSSLVVSIIVTAILSRSLAPKDFGTVAIATFFINFFSTLTTSGFSPAIVQNRLLNRKDIEHINCFTFYLGVGLSLLFGLFAHSIASFYDDNEHLEIICYLLSVNIFFSVICIVPNAVLLKDKQFKFISIRMLVVNFIGGVLSVIGVIFNLGIFALTINPIFSSIMIYLITVWKEPIKISFSFEIKSVKKILNYSIYQMLFNFVYLLYRGIDKLMIGKSFDFKTLGYYEKSYSLMLLPLENITTVISPVLHPILSEIQFDQSRIINSYLKLVRFLSEVGFFLSVCLFFCARELVLIVFGDQWESSVPIFRIFALSIGIQVTQSPVGAILQALNKVRERYTC